MPCSAMTPPVASSPSQWTMPGRDRVLAGVLMHALMHLARRRGIKVMEGTVLATNSAMLKFMRQLGFRREPVKGDAQVARVVRAL